MDTTNTDTERRNLMSKLEELLAEHGTTVEELEERLNRQGNTLLSSGEQTLLPHPAAIQRIADELGVTVFEVAAVFARDAGFDLAEANEDD